MVRVHSGLPYLLQMLVTTGSFPAIPTQSIIGGFATARRLIGGFNRLDFQKRSTWS